MKIIKDKLYNAIRDSRFSDVNITNIQYNDDEAIITVEADDHRSYDNQSGFGNIEFKFTIDNDGNASNFEYIYYDNEDMAKGADGLCKTTLPDEDDPTYSDCVEKIVQEQLDYAKSNNSELFNFFGLYTNYSNCLDETEQEIKEVFSKYFTINKIEVDNWDVYEIDIDDKMYFNVSYDEKTYEWNVAFYIIDYKDYESDDCDTLEKALVDAMKKAYNDVKNVIVVFNKFFK